MDSNNGFKPPHSGANHASAYAMAHNQNSDASAIPTDSLSDGSAQGESEKAGAPAPPAFPDGGLRAWSVAAGHAGAMFCTFGYINSFGFVTLENLLLENLMKTVANICSA